MRVSISDTSALGVICVASNYFISRKDVGFVRALFEESESSPKARGYPWLRAVDYAFKRFMSVRSLTHRTSEVKRLIRRERIVYQ